MNKFALLFVYAVAAVTLFASCSDTDASEMTGATTEPNTVSVESSGAALSSDAETVKSSSSSDLKHSSSVNAGMQQDSLKLPMSQEMQDLCDSILNSLSGSYSQNLDSKGGSASSTESSVTTYDFKSEREAFYEENGCYVSVYEEESGVRYLPSREGGFFEITSLVYPEKEIVLRMLNNSYWSEFCEKDFEVFRKECEIENGIFKDYKDGKGCSQNQKIEAACAISMPGISLREILEKEAGRYRNDCVYSVAATPKDDPCTIICRIETGMESYCDTTCNE